VERLVPDSYTALDGSSLRGPVVLVHPDPDGLALAAATTIVQAARRSAKRGGRFTVALAGGATPKRTYEFLAGLPFADLMPWERVHVFWADERCVDRADSRSNERMARDALLDHVPIPTDQIHPMMCGTDAVESEAPFGPLSEDVARRSAEAYEGLLRDFFPALGGTRGPDAADRQGTTETALDLVLLGLGDDGHTASLLPDSEVLCEERRWVAPVFADAPASAGTTAAGQDLWRVTMTAPFINRAASVVFLVSGTAKAAMVRQVLEGPVDTARLPAQLIRPKDGTLRWYLDEESAALLTAGPGRG
jgi:6-phosphogluconolactonase